MLSKAVLFNNSLTLGCCISLGLYGEGPNPASAYDLDPCEDILVAFQSEE